MGRVWYRFLDGIWPIGNGTLYIISVFCQEFSLIGPLAHWSQINDAILLEHGDITSPGIIFYPCIFNFIIMHPEENIIFQFE